MEKLRNYLGIPDNSKDIQLEFIIADVEEIIKNYCNIKEIPEGLLQTSYRMAIDLYRKENIGNEEGAAMPVASLTEGDTSVSFRQGADEGYKDTILKNYAKSLNRYRRVRFV